MTAVWVTHLVLLATLVLFTAMCLRDLDLPEAVEVGVTLGAVELGALLFSLDAGSNAHCLEAVATTCFCVSAALASRGRPACVIDIITGDKVELSLHGDPASVPSHLGARTFAIFALIMTIVHGAHPVWFSLD